jgi:hypothetical protein
MGRNFALASARQVPSAPRGCKGWQESVSNHGKYENKVYVLPKHLDEKVAARQSALRRSARARYR